MALNKHGPCGRLPAGLGDTCCLPRPADWASRLQLSFQPTDRDLCLALRRPDAAQQASGGVCRPDRAVGETSEERLRDGCLFV